MNGAPIAAARAAAQGLVDRLNVDDQAAVVSFADGEFRVHGVAALSLRPFATNVERPDEFMAAQSGDQVSLPGGNGEYVIHFLSTEAAQNLDSPAADGETAPSPADAAVEPSIEPPPTDPGTTPQPPPIS
jgi:hypothetical protein